jgi:nitroimidazol reductase NimA-like FMN-containing flavoprotein (pyridoxamine 5'-phosphate oxidase superfamily)
MRRKDREVTDLSKIIEIIGRCEIARLAMVDNGQPYVVPLNFGYELINSQLNLYFHSALEGRKIDILKANPAVCFEMDCSFKKLESEMACNWSAEFESIIGYGKVEFLESRDEKSLALDCIMKRYGFTGMPIYNDEALKQTAVYKLTVDSLTAKQKL